jgi:hypothetical protein
MTTKPRMTAGALVTLALAASAAPASAMPNQLSPGGAPAVQNPTGAHATPSPAAVTRARVLAARDSAPASPPATIVRLTAHNGFDWGDAGLGAAGAVALAAVGLGGVLAVSQRHDRHPAA